MLAVQHRSNAFEWVLLLALGAMLAALVLVFFRVPLAALFAPLAALFVTARFYTGDPYFDYTSTFTRYADHGNISATWIFVLLAAAILAGVTTHLWRRTPPLESALVLLLLMPTAMFMGAH
jgi:hypothetical protein